MGPGPLEQVIVRRAPASGGYTRVGSSTLVIPALEACRALVLSGFMRSWLDEKMMEHLRAGGRFEAPDDKGNPVTTYEFATEAELSVMAQKGELAKATRTSLSTLGSKAKKSSDATYTIHPTTPQMDEVVSKMPRQARVLVAALRVSGSSHLTIESVQLAVEKVKDELKTKQDPMRIFKFYIKAFVAAGVLTEDVGSAEETGDGEA